MKQNDMRNFASCFSPKTFTLYREGENFTVMRNGDNTIEHIIQKGPSKPHMHPKKSNHMVFLTPAIVSIGGITASPQRVVYMETQRVEKGDIIYVGPSVMHSVAPVTEDKVAEFLIFNRESRDRTSSEYTDDTVVVKNIQYI